MGVGLVPFYDPQVPAEAQYDGDGKGLADEYAALSEISVETGLTPLSQFAHNSEGEFEEYAGEIMEPVKLTYYPINDGLATVEGLIQRIRTMPKIASRLSDPDYTLEELEELARSLHAAQPYGAQFCLFFM